MKPILLFSFLVLLAASVQAQETLPWLKNHEVPDPIPVSFNECVRIIVTEKGHEAGLKGRVGQVDPPITAKDRDNLEYYRSEGWAKLELCKEVTS